MYTVPDTVPAVVLDLGSHTSKVGYAGADVPAALFPSAVGTSSAAEGADVEHASAWPRSTALGGEVREPAPPARTAVGYENLLHLPADAVRNIDVRPALDQDGVVDDWSAYEALMDYSFEALRANPEEHAVFVVEPNHNPKRPREELCQVLFEKYNAPAVYFARSAPLACFAAGRHTGVVLDCGANNVSAVPVFEGSVVKHALLRTHHGSGNELTQRTAELLAKATGNREFRASHEFRRRAVPLTGSNAGGEQEDGGTDAAGRVRTADDADDDGGGGDGGGGGGDNDGDEDDDDDDDDSETTGTAKSKSNRRRVEFRAYDVDARHITESYTAFARQGVLENAKHALCAVNERAGADDVSRSGGSGDDGANADGDNGDNSENDDNNDNETDHDGNDENEDDDDDDEENNPDGEDTDGDIGEDGDGSDNENDARRRQRSGDSGDSRIDSTRVQRSGRGRSKAQRRRQHGGRSRRSDRERISAGGDDGGGGDAYAPPATHELPDGTLVTFRAERYDPPSRLFRDMAHAQTAKEDRPFLAYLRQRTAPAQHSRGAASLVANAAKRCDPPQRKDMFGGVVLTGGSSTLPGLSERLQAELYRHYSRVRVVAASNPLERRYAAWTGGSILATFSEFQSSWFARSEYVENGVSFAHKRCP